MLRAQIAAETIRADGLLIERNALSGRVNAETRRADEEAAGAAAMRGPLEEIRDASRGYARSAGDPHTRAGYAAKADRIDALLASDAGRPILDRLRAHESARVTAEALVLAHEGHIATLTTLGGALCDALRVLEWQPASEAPEPIPTFDAVARLVIHVDNVREEERWTLCPLGDIPDNDTIVAFSDGPPAPDAPLWTLLAAFRRAVEGS